MNTSAKTSSNSTFLHRLNRRFPWLKIVFCLFFVTLAVLDLLTLTISHTAESVAIASVAPMARHARVTERDPKGKMLVALTFDDGPSSATTPRLLDILAEKDVPATFFMLGSKVRANPDLVRRVESEGHEIGSHTTYHQNLIKISSRAIISDLNEAVVAFNNVLGHGPSLLRPPYGNFNNTVRSAAGLPLILWSVDTLDWKNRNTESIVETALSQVHAGAIILMHDVHETSVDAVPTLVDALRAAGYEFVTVSELAKAHNIQLSPGSACYSLRP